MGLFVSYCWTSGIVWKISEQEISKLKMNNTQQRLSNQLLVVFFSFFCFYRLLQYQHSPLRGRSQSMPLKFCIHVKNEFLFVKS
jgi:hypothetical protein